MILLVSSLPVHFVKLVSELILLAATYGFIDGEQAFSAALLLVMVNLAFPYGEMNALAMETALQVLQRMAERGNRYIRACHNLLTKICVMKRLPEPSSMYSSDQNAKASTQPVIEVQLQQEREQDQKDERQKDIRQTEDYQEKRQELEQHHNARNEQQEGQHQQRLQHSYYHQQKPTEQQEHQRLHFEGASDDPSVWADVMDSIGIDMDRQWIGMALMREGLGEELDPLMMEFTSEP